MAPDPSELIEFLAPYPPDVQCLALDARAFLYDLLFPVTELHYDATSAVCAGFCFSDNPSDNFVNIAVYSKHVTLVFSWGAKLMDPQVRLNGEGKQVRHIRLQGIETLQDPYVLDLIRQASENAVQRSLSFEPITIVKVYAGPKRRPNP